MNELSDFCAELSPIIDCLNECFEKHGVTEKCITLPIKNGKVEPFVIHSSFCVLRNAK